MTDQDYEPFIAEFRRVASAFERYPQSLDVIRTRADVYFNVLKKFTFSEVCAKSDSWIQRESKMPKPAEWAGVIIRRQTDHVLSEMDRDEATEWLRAERQRWEDEPCGCGECVAAGVAEMKRRFVPVFDHNDCEVRGTCFGRVVTLGEWIHGYALMRWYLAREDFWTKARTLVGSRSMPGADAETLRHERKLIARKLVAKRQSDTEVVERPRYGEDR